MVYGVFDGQYSDWEVLGYFEKETDAEEYCKTHDGYILPLLNLKTGDPDVRRAYWFSTESGEYRKAFVEDKYSEKWREPEVKKHFNWRRQEYELNEYDVLLYVKPDDEYKIPKIAYDAIAKWKAEKEGIT